MAAIVAARNGANVTLLEADIKAGRKLLKTGNGRCNLSNAALQTVEPFAAQIPADTKADIENATSTNNPFVTQIPADAKGCGWSNASYVAEVFSSPLTLDVLKFFTELGLLTYTDSQGRIYPSSNRARSVLDVLLAELNRLNVDLIYECELCSLRHIKDEGWLAICRDKRAFSAKRLVLACSEISAAKEALKEAGATLTKRVPVLGPIRTQRKIVRMMDGVRLRCHISLLRDGKTAVAEAKGEVLFRKYGISGIVAFEMSRVTSAGDILELDLLPSMNEQELITNIEARIERCKQSGYGDAVTMLDGMFIREVSRAMLANCKIQEDTKPAKVDASKLARSIKHFRLEVLDGPTKDEAQVLRGGVSTSSIDPKSMEITDSAGLYVCGEAIDIDGPCGGFNLHWAWVTGAIAGASAASGTGASAASGTGASAASGVGASVTNAAPSTATAFDTSTTSGKTND